MSLEPISSFETLQKSIRYDFYAGRWFHYFIRSTGMQKLFAGDLAIHAGQYAAYRNWTRLADSVFLVAVVFSAVAWVRGSFFLYAVSFLMFLAFQYIGSVQKKRLVFLSSALLRYQFSPGDFRMMSLFQISEQLSRRYGVFSFVDAISMSDNFLRKLFLVGYLLPWPDVARSLLVFCLVYFSCKYGLNTAVVYEGIRKRHQRLPSVHGIA
jgi:hypothetical protein